MFIKDQLQVKSFSLYNNGCSNGTGEGCLIDGGFVQTQFSPVLGKFR